jgi:hypothetical protein
MPSGRLPRLSSETHGLLTQAFAIACVPVTSPRFCCSSGAHAGVRSEEQPAVRARRQKRSPVSLS